MNGDLAELIRRHECFVNSTSRKRFSAGRLGCDANRWQCRLSVWTKRKATSREYRDADFKFWICDFCLHCRPHLITSKAISMLLHVTNRIESEFVFVFSLWLEQIAIAVPLIANYHIQRLTYRVRARRKRIRATKVCSDGQKTISLINSIENWEINWKAIAEHCCRWARFDVPWLAVELELSLLGINLIEKFNWKQIRWLKFDRKCLTKSTCDFLLPLSYMIASGRWELVRFSKVRPSVLVWLTLFVEKLRIQAFYRSGLSSYAPAGKWRWIATVSEMRQSIE